MIRWFKALFRPISIEERIRNELYQARCDLLKAEETNEAAYGHRCTLLERVSRLTIQLTEEQTCQNQKG